MRGDHHSIDPHHDLRPSGSQQLRKVPCDTANDSIEKNAASQSLARAHSHRGAAPVTERAGAESVYPGSAHRVKVAVIERQHIEYSVALGLNDDRSVGKSNLKAAITPHDDESSSHTLSAEGFEPLGARKADITILDLRPATKPCLRSHPVLQGNFDQGAVLDLGLEVSSAPGGPDLRRDVSPERDQLPQYRVAASTSAGFPPRPLHAGSPISTSTLT